MILPHQKDAVVVVDGDPLAQGFMDRLAERIIQMGFPAEDQGEAELCHFSVMFHCFSFFAHEKVLLMAFYPS